MTGANGTPSKRLTCDDMLGIIERDVRIGDSIMAGRRLNRWSSHIEASLDSAGQNRLAKAKTALGELLAYEAIHGQFSRLDRQSPEIVRYERGVRQFDLVSIYGTVTAESAASSHLSATWIASL